MKEEKKQKQTLIRMSEFTKDVLKRYAFNKGFKFQAFIAIELDKIAEKISRQLSNNL